MRVIAGTYRSRPLRALPGTDTRPTSDKLRETLFNVLVAARPLEDSVWLDLFAGTGAVGIEALSRGARQVHFVEQSKKAAAVIRENLRSLQIGTGFEIVERDAVRAIESLDKAGVALDFCFLDPPYRMHSAYTDSLNALTNSRLLQDTTLVIAEHDKRFDPGADFGPLKRYRVLTQGDAALSFYALKSGAGAER